MLVALGRAAGLLHQHHTQEPGWRYVVRADKGAKVAGYGGDSDPVARQRVVVQQYR